MSTSHPCRVRSALVVAALLGAAAVSNPSSADEPQKVAAPKVGEADQLFEEGVAARKTGKLNEAEALFQKAWALKKTWDIAANLGLVELKLGKLEDGAGRVSYAIANLPPTESDSTRESLTKALDAARPSLGEVTVTCNVGGAEVRIGGNLKGNTPMGWSVFAAPGDVAVEVAKPGYETVQKKLTVAKGSSQTVDFALRSESPPGPSRMPAYLSFGTGGVGLLLGVITGAASLAKYGEVTSACAGTACPAHLLGEAETGKVLGHISTVGFVVAGLGAALGVTFIVLPRGELPARTSLVLGPSFVGMKGAF